ncbi:MAG TPA: ATP-grasp domain-containing protein, partial [Caulobacteraceae bacterium]|nr:ATP-grasp domain-containing protein [Caulobacteraceae bacterium]
PILVQEFVSGEDVGASVYCVNGEIKSFIAHRYHRAIYSTFFEQRIFDDIAKIARHSNVNGVLNFDMRLTKGGGLFYLECNPRFFFKIAMSMLAGVNFVAAGLPGCGAPLRLEASETIRFPKALLAALPTPWRLKGGAAVLRHLLSDPTPWLREELGLERDAVRN